MQWLVNPDVEILDWKAVCGKTARTVWKEGRLIAFPTPIPFEKGGLRGIYLIKSPLTPLFKEGD